MSGTLIFPDFSQKCPICGRPHCARMHATYTRKLHHEIIIVQRWICSSSLKTEGLYRTFSVLPYQAIPYLKYDIEFSKICYEHIYIAKNTRLTSALDAADKMNDMDTEFITTVFHYALVFQTALAKWHTFCERTGRCLEPLFFMNVHVRSTACADYHRVTGDFLFGTPSQKRLQAKSKLRNRSP